jgi:hypothetical protein
VTRASSGHWRRVGRRPIAGHGRRGDATVWGRVPPSPPPPRPTATCGFATGRNFFRDVVERLSLATFVVRIGPSAARVSASRTVVIASECTVIR